MGFLPEHALCMAPMVDLSHVAYRELIRAYSGCDLFYSEMLNSRMVPSEDPFTSPYLKWVNPRDLIFQIVGDDPTRMQKAAGKLDTYVPWGIDINMGCWLNKVVRHGWGVALMKNITLASQVVRAVREITPRPLSVKMRLGDSLDKDYLLDFVEMLTDSGVDFIVVHARTALDGMKRKARWEYIAFIKQHSKVPIIGNGDISSARHALDMFNQTGCNGVMIGRQALITPWIFRDIKSLLAGETAGAPPNLQQVILDLSFLIEKHFPPQTALKRMKTALPWLARNLTFGHFLSKVVSKAAGMDEIRSRLLQCFETGIS
ncbi:MAG: tRNA-dihydrouridine synthase family protein [Deltaproteobacteria bacterium]|nr:tRNA-dihydrouridine synthase family protein [Deltaproteobacteria bacterium]